MAAVKRVLRLLLCGAKGIRRKGSVASMQGEGRDEASMQQEVFYDYNRSLPPTYAKCVAAEGERFLEEIKRGVALCLVTHDAMLVEHSFKQVTW